jgi:hypothetical protein
MFLQLIMKFGNDNYEQRINMERFSGWEENQPK